MKHDYEVLIRGALNGNPRKIEELYLLLSDMFKATLSDAPSVYDREDFFHAIIVALLADSTH